SYQPNGMAEFDAKPLSGQVAVSRASAKRRQSTQRGAAEGRSFKLTHMIAAAVLVMAVSYVGKHYLMGSDNMQQPIASWVE
ncbi:MAG: hypothetical protein MI867_08305, partial [Pseudomonadales bacterium]|nr:hypothetical protein [Pseudomonadales bacterium]